MEAVLAGHISLICSACLVVLREVKGSSSASRRSRAGSCLRSRLGAKDPNGEETIVQGPAFIGPVVDTLAATEFLQCLMDVRCHRVLTEPLQGPA